MFGVPSPEGLDMLVQQQQDSFVMSEEDSLVSSGHLLNEGSDGLMSSGLVMEFSRGVL